MALRCSQADLYVQQLLKDEMVMNMRLIGATSVADLTPDMVDCTGLKMHTTGVPEDSLSIRSYDALITPHMMLKSKL
jgi:L-lactate dehydrogenase (cytochrome)